MSNRNKDICAGSGSRIPAGGAVLCVCGQYYTEGDYVPLHYPGQGPVEARKVAQRLDRALAQLQLKRMGAWR